MRWWAGLLGRRLRARGIAVNDCVVGLAQTGAFTPEAMEAALAALPDGLTELYTHPATADVWPGSALPIAIATSWPRWSRPPPARR
jgi:hypothetical protein